MLKRGILVLSNPLQRGCVTSWPDLEKIIAHALLNGLSITPSEFHMLFTLPPLTPAHEQEKLAELMFETFDIPAFYLGSTAAMSLLAAGRRSGVVLESGNDLTHTVPIYDGRSLPHAIHRINFGGRDVTDALQILLEKRGYSFTTAREREDVYKIKEELAIVKPKRNDSKNSTQNFEKEYKSEDYVGMVLADERWECTEPYFVNENHPGVHQLLHQSILKCDEPLRAAMYSNVILSGGSMQIPGMAERISEELSCLVAPAAAAAASSVKVIAPMMKDQAFVGATKFASQPNFFDLCIEKSEYKEQGARIVNEKCF